MMVDITHRIWGFFRAIQQYSQYSQKFAIWIGEHEDFKWASRGGRYSLLRYKHEIIMIYVVHLTTCFLIDVRE